MHIYIAGVGGTGLSPLARLAQDCGFKVAGSDLQPNANTDMLKQQGVTVYIGQSGREIAQEHQQSPIDWFVYSSALPPGHPELVFAQEHGIRATKRDAFFNHVAKTKNLQIVAASGTHGKTTATAMLVWCFKQLGEPLSYAIGTNIDFGASAAYEPDAKFFIYEADEFDRNFLSFAPFVSVVTTVDYDHRETYPTPEDYQAAFREFINQSEHTFSWQEIIDYLELSESQSTLHIFGDQTDTSQLTLAGEHNRRNGFLVLEAVKWLLPHRNEGEIVQIINKYPGSERRMEQLARNLYTDYAHHPAEIAATIQLAREMADKIVVVYQPHQNIRQHEVKDLYQHAFDGAQHVYWLPTYLTREDPDLPVLKPDQLTSHLNQEVNVDVADLDQSLARHIREHIDQGTLVVLMGAGSIDDWARANIKQLTP